ncbi:MAG: hypothetical protein FGM54_11115 [Chitinophagaceae bacterium]|nr:hypothetical protein [Chitinophagaceae bacterium]
MRTFLADIFPSIQRYSERLDDLTILTNQHWVSVDDILNTKTVYIFRPNNDLFISKNGNVEKARWEYLGNNFLIIENSSGNFLFKHGFRDRDILALKLDSRDEYAVFVNENRYGGDLNSIDKVIHFLERNYLTNQPIQIAQNQTTQQTVFRELIEGQTLKIVSKNYKTIGAKVFINEMPAPDGIYIYKSLTHKLEIKNGEIVERYFLEKFKSFIIEKNQDESPSRGDRVYNLDWTPIVNGEIRYSFLNNLVIKNGKIV